ncbi:MAG: hypothetical protein AB7K64_08730 [Variibacter sp.]
MRRALKPFWVLLALLFLFEAWLWEKLQRAVAWLVRLLALPVLRAKLAVAIERLPPWATLIVFIIPVLLLLPIKIAGLWMLAHGSWLGAMAMLAVAKVVSVGVTAFIFDATRPKLLQMAWFRRLYEWVLHGLAWAHGLVDPVKEEVRAFVRETAAPILRRARALIRREGGGRFWRQVQRLRRRTQRV